MSGPASFDDMTAEEHLACAVDISAWTYLVADGKLPEEREMISQAVLAVAWHHNAFAVPQSKGEQYDLVNRKRDELLAGDRPDAIAARARVCIEAALAKSEAK